MDMSDFSTYEFIHFYSPHLKRYVLPRQIIESMYDLPLKVAATLLGISDSAMSSIEHATSRIRFKTDWPHHVLKPDQRAWFVQRRIALTVQILNPNSEIDIKSAEFLDLPHVRQKYNYDLTQTFIVYKRILDWAQYKCVVYISKHLYCMSEDWFAKSKAFLDSVYKKETPSKRHGSECSEREIGASHEDSSMFWECDQRLIALDKAFGIGDSQWSLPAGVQESKWFSEC